MCHCYMLKSRLEIRFYLTYRPSALQTKYRPRKEKNGLRLASFRCDVAWGFLRQIDACKPCQLFLASIGFVIKWSLPSMSTSSLASIAFVMTGVLARLSISLSKHCELVPTPDLLAVCRSQQASDLDAQFPIVRGEAPLKPHYVL